MQRGAGGEGWVGCVCVCREGGGCEDGGGAHTACSARTCWQDHPWQRWIPLLTHQQGDLSSASCSRGHNEIRGFSSYHFTSRMHHTQSLPWHPLQEPLCKLESMGWETAWNQRCKWPAPCQGLLTSPHAILRLPRRYREN